MALSFSDIHYQYGDLKAVDGVSFCAQPGEITCLLGPSGCGKTTLLNLAAGILKVQSGEIWLDDAALANTEYSPPPEKRPVGLVFQDGALFPHMNVEKNISFGVVVKEQRKKVTSQLLQQIGLASYGKRYPHTLSGGQQQRVAVARALAGEPKVLLLDEPFANIDILRRRQLREEITDRLRKNGCITLLVTHDPDEAMEIADQIAIMKEGRIVQFGSPQDLYDKPSSPDIAMLIGKGTLIPAENRGNILVTPFGMWPLTTLSERMQLSNKGKILIRGNSIEPKKANTDMVISEIRRMGPFQTLTIKNAKGKLLKLEISGDQAFEIGDYVELVPRKNSLIGFEGL